MASLRDGVYELKIGRDGLLPLTRELAEGLDFQEGDQLALDPGPASVRIESYRELLNGLDMAAEGEMRWTFLAEFLSRPLTVVGPGHGIEIPAEVMPLGRGQTAMVQILDRGVTREVYLLREEVMD